MSSTVWLRGADGDSPPYRTQRLKESTKRTTMWSVGSQFGALSDVTFRAIVCSLAAGSRTFAPAMTAGVVLLLATVPARVRATHGANALGQITQDDAVADGFAWDQPTRDDTHAADWMGCEFRPGTGVA